MLLCILFVYCKSQDKQNPNSLGSQNFDVIKMNFDENINTLMGKNTYYKSNITDNSTIIGYNFILSKKQNKLIKISFGNINISDYKNDFKVDKNEKLIGVNTTFTLKEDIKKKIINEIDNNFKKYKVNIKQLYNDPTIYRWELPDKVIQFSYSKFETNNIYAISVFNKKFNCNNISLEKIFIGEDICLKQYKIIK